MQKKTSIQRNMRASTPICINLKRLLHETQKPERLLVWDASRRKPLTEIHVQMRNEKPNLQMTKNERHQLSTGKRK